ncbi:MAG: selenium cofactor biosynthesis protein YqeC [Rhodospirillales bacterium]|nr:selenium cofactor biosynthesis protein YqeC [Rhodospirillales bacterium]
MSIIDDLGLGRDRVIAVAGAGGKTSLIKALGLALAQEGKRVLATTTTKVAANEFNNGWRSGTRIDDGETPFFLYGKASDDGAKWIGLAPEAVDEIAKSRKFDVILVEADGSRRCPLKAPAAHEPVIPSCADGLILVAGLSGFGRPLGEETVFRSDLWAAITGAGFNDPVTPDDWWRVATDLRGYGRVLSPGRRNLMFLNQDDAPGAEEVFGQLAALMQQEKGRFDGLAMGRLWPAPVLSQTWFDRQTISP